MTVIIAAIVGFLTGRMLWIALRQTWQRESLMRTNYRGVSMPTAAGVVMPFALLVVESIRAVMGALGVGADPGLSGVRAAAFVAVLGFAILGLLDDLTGTTSVRGFGGHMRALGRGELTSGALKMIVGAAVCVSAASVLNPDGLGGLLADAAVLALAANLFNLLDLRPGRTSKCAIAVFAVIAAVSMFDTALVPAAVIIGAGAALVLDDLHERLMLGDTGANILGVAVGLALVTQLDTTGTLIALGVLTALNLLSEVVSFSKIIESVGVLRTLDDFGRKNPRSAASEEEVIDLSDGSRARIRDTVDGAHEGPSAATGRSTERIPFEPSSPVDDASGVTSGRAKVSTSSTLQQSSHHDTETFQSNSELSDLDRRFRDAFGSDEGAPEKDRSDDD